MKSPVVKRSIVVAGHKTSVSLEEAFWNGMKEISGLRDMTLSELVGEIDAAIVATPTGTHHAIGMDLLSGGVSLLIEKPIAPTATQADELATEAPATATTTGQPALVESDLLVEDVSIDGMCGVY